MNGSTFKDIEKLEADLWAAADNLRANSKLTSSDYFMPVLGIIFLRHAANRFDAATRQIARGPGQPAKCRSERCDRRLHQPPRAGSQRRPLRLDHEGAAISGTDLPKLVTDAMNAIEAEFEPLKGVLPKDYGIFEPKVLEDLMRLFNSEQIKQATGDVFGRIYEYFLTKFSDAEGARQRRVFHALLARADHRQRHRAGPRHGLRPGLRLRRHVRAVEPLHRAEGGDTATKVVFYGQEKNRTTIRWPR